MAKRKAKWGDLIKTKDGIIQKVFTPHQAQIDCLTSTARYIAFIAGTNSGKTSCGCLWLFHQIEKNKGKGIYLIVAPTYDIVLSSTLESWKLTVKGTSFEGKWTGGTSNPHYTCPSGAIIYFRSSDAELYGHKPLAILVDEAGLMSISEWHKILSRIVGSDGGKIFLSTTPYIEQNWLKKEIIDRADAGDPNYFYRTCGSHCNPTTDLGALEEYKKSMPKWEYDMKYNGVFTKIPGQVYEWFSSDGDPVFTTVPPEGLPEAATYIGGIDWGGRDATCWLTGLLDYNNCLWIFNEFYKPNCDILETFDSIIEWHDKFKEATGVEVSPWFSDHRPDSIMGLRKLGINAKPAIKGRNSIEIGISLINSRIRQGKLKIIQKECPNLKREGLSYRYNLVDEQVVGNKPMNGQDDHALDSLRMLVSGIDRKDAYKMCIQKGYEYTDEE